MPASTQESSAFMDRLFKAGAHIAYSRTRRHPSVASFIFGAKNQVEIFDLEKVEDVLNEALDAVRELGKKRAAILFVSGKHEAKELVKAAAQELHMPFVAGRWIGGTLTNFSEIKKRMARLSDLLEQRSRGAFEGKYTKRERLMFDREIAKLEHNFGGIMSLKEVPSALFVVDPRREHAAVAEAKTMGIPVLALSNSDCDVRPITYPIVGNDAARTSIALFLHEVTEAYREGLAQAAAPKEIL